MADPQPVATPVPPTPLIIPLLALVSAVVALDAISQIELPAKIAYRVGRLADDVAANTKPYHTQRLALLKKYGTERPATDLDVRRGLVQSMSETVLEVGAADMPAFTAEYEDLCAIPVTLESQWLLTLDMFEGYKVSGGTMRGLGTLISG
jgi:hypothetical protein